MDKGSPTQPDYFDRLLAVWHPASEAHAGLSAGSAFNDGLADFAQVYEAHRDDWPGYVKGLGRDIRVTPKQPFLGFIQRLTGDCDKSWPTKISAALREWYEEIQGKDLGQYLANNPGGITGIYDQRRTRLKGDKPPKEKKPSAKDQLETLLEISGEKTVDDLVKKLRRDKQQPVWQEPPGKAPGYIDLDT